ncbi:hypothetical protein [Pseudoalteromonas phenolica]|uniref:hypothetical protein n=1 Tax=Pseudoalteromonas phenolica TaxID=161398 RepID=UPI00110A8A2C|nr:hypothetical protein [Pseudoalteromonas phenolica]TMO53974.1 hypothetical protein CWC21_17230 [Pseudoalteromonas phenolica]
MGNKKFNLTKLALAMGVTLSLSGCFSDNDNNVEIKPPVVPPTTVKVPVSDTKEALSFYVNASVVDATADDLTVVPNATVKFFDNGVASENITDVSGNAITELTTATGAFTFNVDSDSDISEVTVIISAEGYFNKTSVIDFGDKDAVVESLITLAKKDSLVVKEATAAASGGKLSEDLTTKTDDDSVTVAISSDVELRDAEGNAVTGEEVSISLVTAPLDAEDGKAAAIDVLPEGFSAVANDDATLVVEPAGYVEVNMSAGDTAIKSFDTPISITTTVKGDFAEGDKFAITSFNEETGVWTKETGEATLGAGNEMTFPASFTTDHLTGFLLSRTKEVCDAPVTYTVTGSDIPSSGLFMVLISNSFLKINKITESSGTLVTQADLKRFGVAKDATVEAILFDVNDFEFGNVASTNLCGEIEIAATAPTTTLVDDALPMTFSCSNAEVDDQLPLGGAVVTYAQTGKIPLVASESANGTYALNGLVSGEEYNVTVNTRIEGFTVDTFTITAGSTEAQNFVRDNCVVEDKEVTGTGSGS